MQKSQSNLTFLTNPASGDSDEVAMRRLTLTRMLIWAAREAREIDCMNSAEHVEFALDAIADCIQARRPSSTA